jgi:hypothetical protein
MARKAKKPAASKRKLDAETKNLGRKLDQVMASARKAEASVRAGSARQLAVLGRKQAQARVVLAKLGRQSAAASAPLKSGLRRAWRDLEAAVRQASKRFRETP